MSSDRTSNGDQHTTGSTGAFPPATPDLGGTTTPPTGQGVRGEHEGNSTVIYRPVVPVVRPGRYRPKRFHAKGGMGEVWVTDDCDLGREVALKKLRRERAPQKDRFLAEAQITGQLEHPGIVPVYDLGLDEEGQPFYIMKFVTGRTLHTAILEHHAPGSGGVSREVGELRLLQAFLALCQATAYAHSRGVVHRDLKPDNIMLGPYGETLVLDWGLAKVLGQPESSGGSSHVHLTYSSGSAETGEGVALGSPAYMSPELADGRAAAADTRTDVYLLGSTLYEILTGHAPREGRSRDEMIELARTVSPPPPRRLKPDVPRALEAICLQAMARRPQDRYAAAHDLAEDVQRYLAGEPGRAYPEPWWDRGRRWARRHRRVLTAAAAVLVVAAAALFGVKRFNDYRDRQEEALHAAGQREQDARAREDAGQQVETFRRLADDVHLASVGTASYMGAAPTGAEPYHDPRRTIQAGREALDLARGWGADLEGLPLPEFRAALRGEVYDLLLLLAHATADERPGAAQEGLALLDQAARLRPGTSRVYHRLRARALEAKGDQPGATAEEERARRPDGPAGALDYFLEGEAYRRQAAAVGATEDRYRDLLELALGAYNLAVAADVKYYWAHFQRGCTLLNLGRRREAVEAFGACVALRPDAPWGYNTRGLAEALLNRKSEAQRDLAAALKLRPDFRPARLHHGVTCWMQGRTEEALADFDAVLQPPAAARLPEAAYYRAWIYLQRKQPDRALADLDLVVADQPAFQPAYLLRARAQLARRDAEAAMGELTRCAVLSRKEALDPESAEAYEQRGRLLRGLNEPALALRQFQKAQERGGQSAGLLAEKGVVLLTLEKYDDTINTFTAAIELKKDDAKLYVNRGWAYVLRPKPDYELGRKDFLVAARLIPNDPEVHAALGYIAARRQAPSEAQREALEALAKGARRFLIVHNVASIYANLTESDPDQATEHRRVALDLFRQALDQARAVGAEGEERGWLDRERRYLPPAFARDDAYLQLLRETP